MPWYCWLPIGLFALSMLWLLYEVRHAPLVDSNYDVRPQPAAPEGDHHA